MYCGNCGTELPDPNQQFCLNCGIPLKYLNMINSIKISEYDKIIAGAIIKGRQIIYTTDNWDISGDVDRLLSSWSSQKAQFIMLSGVKYSVLKIEAERLVAMSYKGEGHILATKDDDDIIILQVNPEKSKIGNFPFPYNFNPLRFKSVEKKIKYIMKTESIDELTIERQYLPEIFGAEVLEISKDDGLPILEPFVRRYLLSKGIFTGSFGNIIKLKKTKPLGFFELLDSELQAPKEKAPKEKSDIKHNSRDIKRIDSKLKDEIQSFLAWIKDSEGLAGYINYYLQQNNPQVISKLSRIYNELKQILGIQKTEIEIQKTEKMVKKSKNSRRILKSMRIDPETAVSDMMHSDSSIIAVAVIKSTQLIYTTDNWDISGDVDRLLSSWSGQNAQFIMVSGVKYSILQMEAERLEAMSYKGEDSIVAAKDDDYIIILQVNFKKSKNGNFPFPYIFKPPSPPRDLRLAGEPQAKLPKKSIFKEHKINEYITLKLENIGTHIYVNGKRFLQCIRLFLQIPPQESHLYEDVESIDEAAEVHKQSLWENRIVEGPMAQGFRFKNRSITPEQEFWGHCSNLQAWVEHEYDTRVLMSNISFPLLKKLTEAGDPIAKKVFKEEIAQRLESGHPSVVQYLLNQGYTNYFTSFEFNTIIETTDLIKILSSQPEMLSNFLQTCTNRFPTILGDILLKFKTIIETTDLIKTVSSQIKTLSNFLQTCASRFPTILGDILLKILELPEGKENLITASSRKSWIFGFRVPLGSNPPFLDKIKDALMDKLDKVGKGKKRDILDYIQVIDNNQCVIEYLEGYHQEREKLMAQMSKSEKKIRRLKGKLVELGKRYKKGENVSDLANQVKNLLHFARIQKKKATLEFKIISKEIFIHEEAQSKIVVQYLLTQGDIEVFSPEEFKTILETTDLIKKLKDSKMLTQFLSTCVSKLPNLLEDILLQILKLKNGYNIYIRFKNHNRDRFLKIDGKRVKLQIWLDKFDDKLKH